MSMTSHGLRIRLTAVTAIVLIAATAGAQTSSPGQQGKLFPTPFVIEHYVVQNDADGSSFASEPVADYYGGSWIVSERADGSRLIVDLARQDMTEIRPDRGSYTVLGFSRFAELRRRLQQAERPDPGGEERGSEERNPIIEFADVERGPTGLSKSFSEDDRPEKLMSRPGVRRMLVTARLGDDLPESSLDIWFDPNIKLGARALVELQNFEKAIAGEGPPDRVPPTRLIAAARVKAAGALVFRTVRAVDPEGAVTIEDSAIRIEELSAFPTDLLEIPEGLRRAPHPLEMMVEYAEEEAELRDLMRVKE